MHAKPADSGHLGRGYMRCLHSAGVQRLSSVLCGTDARATGEAAARLSRADLATSLVTEMTGLAGTLGRHYALHSGVEPDVAEVNSP